MREDGISEPELRGSPTRLLRGTTVGAHCTECPFAKNGRPARPVTGEGPADPRWLIIGEGPGQTEITLNHPFSGPSGQLVNQALDAIKVDRSTLWISNATLCLPTANSGDREKALARKYCSGRLLAEISQFPRKPILALGAVAAQALTNLNNLKINDVAGSFNEVNPDGTGLRAVIPTIHPAAILRGGAGIGGAHAPDLAFWNLIYDAAKIEAIASGKDIRFREEDIVTECYDPKRAEQLVRAMLQEARHCRMVAVDTETYVDNEQKHSALQPLNAKMRAIGLATPNWGLSIAWNIVTPTVHRLLAALFADLNVRKVVHNRLYDRPVLRRHGLPVYGVCDCTMLKHHSAFPGLSHQLQRVATQYFAISPWKSEFRKGKDTIENLISYNAKDALVAARLDAPLDTAIQHTASRRTYDVDLVCAEVAEWMYDVGVPVSREVNQELYVTFAQNMKASRAAIENAANTPEVREELWLRLAAEQARRVRQGSNTKPDPENFDDRKYLRLEEIKQAHEKGTWRWNITSNTHLAGLLRVCDIPLERTDKGYAKITAGTLKAHIRIPVIEALHDFRKDKDETARWAVENYAARPEIQEQLWENIAFEQAQRKRAPTGTPADPESYEDRIKVRLEEIRWAHEKGDWSWNIGSSDHITAYLRARGVSLFFKTEKGKTSTKKEILEQYAHLPEVRGLLDYRESQKLFSTFVYSMFDRYDESNAIAKYGCADEHDRIHPRWSVHKITGRWGAEDPSVMNWSKGDKKRGIPNLRTQVVAGPGRMLVGFDFRQLEVRIVALLSGDPWLCDVFKSSRDIHSEFARVVFPDFDNRPAEERVKLRDTVKRPEFGALYGGQVETLWKNIVKDHPEVKLQDIARMVALMTKMMPGVTAWHQRLLRDIAKPPHEIRSAIYGRRRCFPLGNADMNDVYNFPVQCGKYDQHILTTDGWVQYQDLDATRHVLVQHAGTTTNYVVHKSGKQQLFELFTQGRHTEITGKHHFLKYMQGAEVSWQMTDDIHSGDWIVVREDAIPTPHRGVRVSHVNEDVAELIGALFGNGTYKGRGFCISTGSWGYQNHIARVARRALPDLQVKRGRTSTGVRTVACYSKIVQQRLSKWQMKAASKRNKRLPLWVETAPRNIQIALLRGLFDTDGGFAGRWLNYTSCVESAIWTIHRLLLGLGIDNRVRKTWSKTPKGERRQYFRAQLMPWGVDQFRKVVGFRHPTRKKWLATRELATPRRPVPPGLVTYIGEAIHDRVHSLKKSWTALDHARLHRARRGSASYEQLCRLLKKTAAAGAQTTDLYTALQWRFEKVIRKRKTSVALTYDLEIFSADHGYVIEGLVTHNSTGADIMATGLLRILPHLRQDYKDAWPILQIHDAMVFECAENDASRLRDDVRECFTQEHTRGNVTVQFPIDAKIDKSWAKV